MKTDAERMALIRQRTAQLQRQARTRQMLLIDAGCMAACLVLVVCLGLAMPGWAGTSVALHVSPTGTAGMLSERGADGYILVGVLSFLLGSCVTILLYRLRPPFSPFALAAGVVIAGVVMRVQVFGPSPLMSGALALTFGTLAYLCFSALQKEKRLRPYEIALLFEMSLQILLFVASEFIRDYTRFSLYYAVDILLTLTLVSFLPHILREEPHDLH